MIIVEPSRKNVIFIDVVFYLGIFDLLKLGFGFNLFGIPLNTLESLLKQEGLTPLYREKLLSAEQISWMIQSCIFTISNKHIHS